MNKDQIVMNTRKQWRSRSVPVTSILENSEMASLMVVKLMLSTLMETNYIVLCIKQEY